MQNNTFKEKAMVMVNTKQKISWKGNINEIVIYHYRGRCPQCSVLVMCSSPLSSFLVPGQHSFSCAELWLLWLNAMSVNNKAPPPIQDLIEEEHVGLACITKIYLSLVALSEMCPGLTFGTG